MSEDGNRNVVNEHRPPHRKGEDAAGILPDRRPPLRMKSTDETTHAKSESPVDLTDGGGASQAPSEWSRIWPLICHPQACSQYPRLFQLSPRMVSPVFAPNLLIISVITEVPERCIPNTSTDLLLRSTYSAYFFASFIIIFRFCFSSVDGPCRGQKALLSRIGCQ